MRRRNRPPKPPLPLDPGDLTWTPYVLSDGPRASHWVRTDNLELFLRSLAEYDGFTIFHGGRDVTSDDIAAVLSLFGLRKEDVDCTFGRTGSQREFRVVNGARTIGGIVDQCTIGAAQQRAGAAPGA